MLINGWAGSGGDNFPYQFRRAGLGKLIGTRTAGALLAGGSTPSLIDGGSVGVPYAAPYGTKADWIIEGYGVAPDIEVVDDPALMADGGDPQLDAAIKLMKEEVKARPWKLPVRPANPNRAGIDFPRATER